ncbi:hypothetical protein GCM10011325_41290 [Dyadobacter sediminis]|nr:hypothetical protein GCM10011325_41290 [Dyadobacter sediminis]
MFLFSQSLFAQTTYFHQDFLKVKPYVNLVPDTGQFSHVVQTVPALSYCKFQHGFMDLVRTLQDSATGGIIRAMRASPFEPNPKTLFIQIRLSAESIQSAAVNAVYFYAGENFNPGNNSFPGNALMFGKFSLHFTGSAFVVKDLETQLSSKAVKTKTPVVITWVLNNSAESFKYKLFSKDAAEYEAIPGSYDLWVNNEPVNRNSKAYPGNSLFSETKLSNFEIRFRNGIGKIRIHDILIREAVSELDPSEVIVAPNPSSGKMIGLKSARIDSASLKLVSMNGKEIPFRKQSLSADHFLIFPAKTLASGMYLLFFESLDRKRKSVRVMVQ